MAANLVDELEECLALLRATAGSVDAVLRRRPEMPGEVRSALEVAALLYRSQTEPPPPKRRNREHILRRIRETDEARPSSFRQHLAFLTAPLS